MRDCLNYFRSSSGIFTANNIFPEKDPKEKKIDDEKKACGIRCGPGGKFICKNKRNDKPTLRRPFCTFHNEYLTTYNREKKKKKEKNAGETLTQEEDNDVIAWRVMELIMFSFSLFVTLGIEGVGYKTSQTRREFQNHERIISNNNFEGFENVAQALNETRCFELDVNVGDVVLAMWERRMRPAMVMNKGEDLTVQFFGYSDKFSISRNFTVNLLPSASLLPLIRWLPLVNSYGSVIFIEVPGQLFNRKMLQAVSCKTDGEEIKVNVTDVYPTSREKSSSTYLHVPTTAPEFDLSDLPTVLMQPAQVRAIATILDAPGDEWTKTGERPRGKEILNDRLKSALQTSSKEVVTFTLDQWKGMTNGNDFHTVLNGKNIETLHCHDFVEIDRKTFWTPKLKKNVENVTLTAKDTDVPFLTHEHVKVMIDDGKKHIETLRMPIEVDMRTLRPELTKVQFMYYEFRVFRFLHPEQEKFEGPLTELFELSKSRRENFTVENTILIDIDVFNNDFQYRGGTRSQDDDKSFKDFIKNDSLGYLLEDIKINETMSDLVFFIETFKNLPHAVDAVKDARSKLEPIINSSVEKIEFLLANAPNIESIEKIDALFDEGLDDAVDAVLEGLDDNDSEKRKEQLKIKEKLKDFKTNKFESLFKNVKTLSDLRTLLNMLESYDKKESDKKIIQSKLEELRIQKLKTNVGKKLSKGDDVQLYVQYEQPIQTALTVKIREYAQSIFDADSKIKENREENYGGEHLAWKLRGKLHQEMNPIEIAANLCSFIEKVHDFKIDNVLFVLGEQRERTILEVELVGKGRSLTRRTKAQPLESFKYVDEKIYNPLLQSIKDESVRALASQIASGLLTNF